MTSPPQIILASKSPRRAVLLQQMGIPFEVISGEISEESCILLDPVQRVVALSKLKAEAVVHDIVEGLIIAADTIVYINREILGKPKDNHEAREMLQKLSGKTHEVFTGFTLLQVRGKQLSDVERTTVTFRTLESWEIDDYVESGGPLDKAGGYGIQDRSGLFVDRIEGCFYNVVGFPLTKFYEGLKQLWTIDKIRNMMSNEKQL